MEWEECLATKRKDLNALIDHIMHMQTNKPKTTNNNKHNNIDSGATVLNCVLSRLMAELRRSEVELMRCHILSCPNLSTNSPALQTAIPALHDALELIQEKENKMNMSLLTPPALVASILGLTLEEEDQQQHNDSKVLNLCLQLRLIRRLRVIWMLWMFMLLIIMLMLIMLLITSIRMHS